MDDSDDDDEEKQEPLVRLLPDFGVLLCLALSVTHSWPPGVEGSPTAADGHM